MGEVLRAGWLLDLGLHGSRPRMTVDDIRRLHALLPSVDVQAIQPDFVALVARTRSAGIPVSDRRAVKLQRLVAANALLCGRLDAHRSDLWVFRYIWDSEEQAEVLAAIVQEHLKDPPDDVAVHPRARDGHAPDPEEIARDVDAILARIGQDISETERACLRDRLGLLAARAQWVPDEEQRQFLAGRIDETWQRLGARA